MTSSNEKKDTPFGKRLKKFRTATGLTQNQLAQEIGVTRRAIDYYEREGHDPPASILPNLAKALNVSIEELLGVKPLKNEIPKLGVRLQRRLRQIEKMSPKVKKQIVQLLDTFIEAEKLKKFENS
jgi:transcriptional regulator with XRE-family HTH domain